MKRFLLSFAVVLVSLSALAQNDYQAAFFGTQTDGLTDNTGTIQRAIDFISEKGGGTLTFTVGRYLTGAVLLKSNVTIHLKEGAVLLAKPSVYAYSGHKALICAEGESRIAVIGKGCIDGNAKALKADIADQKAKGFITDSTAPALISFKNCVDARVEGIKLINPATDRYIDGVKPVGTYTYFYETGKCITPDGKTIHVQK